MLNKILASLFAIAIATNLAWPPTGVLAGMMLDGVPEANYVSLSNQPQFDAMGRFDSLASGTLIAPNWVLTAGHVGIGVTGFQIRGLGTVYTVAEVIQHPTFVVNNQNISLGFDIELVRLSSAVVGVTPAAIYRGSIEVEQTATITGFGLGGVGSDGVLSLPHAQRAGTNVLDAIVSFAGGAQDSVVVTDFDSTSAGFNTLGAFGSTSTPTALEYHFAPQDSGGGVFINEGGQWYLAGINSGVASQFQFSGSGNTELFGYGALSFMTRVSSFTGFIDSNITAVPEPNSLALVGLLAGCIGARGLWRKRQLRN